MTAFNNFISKHHKSYLTKNEFQERFKIFKQNFDYVQKHNAENKDYKLEANKFADWSDEQKQTLFNEEFSKVQFHDDIVRPENEEPKLESDAILKAPSSVDWR